MSIELPSGGLRRDGLLLRAAGLEDVDTLHRAFERAGFTREGVLRSVPRQRGGRGDMVIFSLLPGE